jgi:hypothetical protein
MAADELPVVRSMADVRKFEGQTARIEGRYEVAPIAGSKRLQPVVIVLSDGEQLIRAYRPRPSEFHLLDCRVVVVGKAYTDANQDPNVQQVMAPHVEVDKIALAEGEQPISPHPKELPTPPLIKDRKGFEARDGRWLRLEATLKSVVPMKDESYWSVASLVLPDGSKVQKNYTPASRWEKYTGKQVTVISRALVKKVAGKTQLWLSGMAEICPGKVERCGMPREPAPMQKKIR